MAKKGKAVASEKSEMTPLFINTTCSREGGPLREKPCMIYQKKSNQEPWKQRSQLTVMLPQMPPFFRRHAHFCITQPRAQRLSLTQIWLSGLLNRPISQTKNLKTEAKRLWDLFRQTTYGLCTTYQSHKPSTTNSSLRSFSKRTRTQQMSPGPSRIMRARSKRTKRVCTLLHLFLLPIVLQQPCYVGCLASPIALNFPQNGYH